MRIYKWLISLVSIIGLFIFGYINNQNIHAMPSINTSNGEQYWFKTRHVRAKHGFKIYKIHDSDPEVDSYTVRSKYIHKNTPFYVNLRGIEWDWTLKNHYFNGSKLLYLPNHYYWIVNGGSSLWKPYRRMHHVYRPGYDYEISHFKQTNSKFIAQKSGYGEYEKVINKHHNTWYEHIINYYDPGNKKSRIRASWDFDPHDHIYWTNTRTGTTYRCYRWNIWKKIN